MNEKELDSQLRLQNIKLTEITKSIISRKRFPAPRAKHFYPSAASVRIDDDLVIGACIRNSW